MEFRELDREENSLPTTDKTWLHELSSEDILRAFKALGIDELWFVIGVSQDNSKNQVRLASDPSDLAMFGPADPIPEQSTSRKKRASDNVFHLDLDFYWLDYNFTPSPAPGAQLVYYPQYPEVRFTGFLKGCRSAPNHLFSYEHRAPGKVVFFGCRTKNHPGEHGPFKEVFALAIPHDARAANWFRNQFDNAEKVGKRLARLPIDPQQPLNSRTTLLQNLQDFRSPWRQAMRMTQTGPIPCKTGANNSAGLHLEYLFGIESNSIPGPDYLDWELKARKVLKPDAPLGSTRQTVFTPDPDGGAYLDMDLVDFVQKWGYKNEKPKYAGKRWDITASGMRIGYGHKRLPNMELRLNGYHSEKRIDVNGALELVDLTTDTIAASWSFSRMLAHWQRKHARTAYVPMVHRFSEQGNDEFRVGDLIHIGEGSKFTHLIKSFANGSSYWDPGIHVTQQENGKWSRKMRSQFRCNARNLPDLYESWEIIDLSKTSFHTEDFRNDNEYSIFNNPKGT